MTTTSRGQMKDIELTLRFPRESVERVMRGLERADGPEALCARIIRESLMSHPATAEIFAGGVITILRECEASRIAFPSEQVEEFMPSGLGL